MNYWAIVATITGIATTWLCGIDWGYTRGVADTEKRWSDAVARADNARKAEARDVARVVLDAFQRAGRS